MKEIDKGLEDPFKYDRKKVSDLFNEVGLYADPSGEHKKVKTAEDWEIIDNRKQMTVKGWDGDTLADAVSNGIDYCKTLRSFDEEAEKKILKIKKEHEKSEKKDKDEIEEVSEEKKEEFKRNMTHLSGALKAVNRKSKPVLEQVFEAANRCLDK